MSSVSILCYEQIYENYWYAQYGPLKVVMVKDSGYFNASKLCNDNGKKFHEWHVENIGLVKYLEQQKGKPAIQSHLLKFISPEIDGAVTGVYCHSLLLPMIGSWVSLTFASDLSDIVTAAAIKKL